MKKYLLAIIIAASALSASAYDIFNSKANRSYIGIRASYELACPGDVKLNSLSKAEIYGNSSGFSASLIYHMPLWKNLFFEPGVSLYYNTYSLNKTLIDMEFDEAGATDIPRPDDASVRQFGIRVPLHMGYHFDVIPAVSISIFTGPEISLGISGENHLSFDDFAVTTEAFGSKGDINRFDFKWRFGVGATFLGKYYAALSGAAGICDMQKGPASMRSNLFDITLGYNF